MVKNLVRTRLPTGYGEFQLYLYKDRGKEHLALVVGDVAGQSGIPVRVHSECLTGDVFGSRRCDCGDQLRHTLQYLGRHGCGILLYLRQEGRGIGLLKKMEAYNLQDQGMDTVEANLRLGHQPDERDYGIAAHILNDLEVCSISLITNNPHKVEELQSHGIVVESRIPIEVGHHADNLGYLRSKAEKMAHLLSFRERMPEHTDLAFMEPLVDQLMIVRRAGHGVPFVTLAYAQGLDGSHGTATAVSPQSLALSRYLQVHHDAWLASVDSLLADEADMLIPPAGDEAPRVIILDQHLQIPLNHPVLKHVRPPLILAGHDADLARRDALLEQGIEVIGITVDEHACLDMNEAFRILAERGFGTILAEGGETIISTLFRRHLVNYCVITITPRLLGGTRALGGLVEAGLSPMALSACQYQPLGPDMIAHGAVQYG